MHLLDGHLRLPRMLRAADLIFADRARISMRSANTFRRIVPRKRV